MVTKEQQAKIDGLKEAIDDGRAAVEDFNRLGMTRLAEEADAFVKLAQGQLWDLVQEVL